jgi:endonuclease/exonuclease/phosphatase family metal-dependent hydrolase
MRALALFVLVWATPAVAQLLIVNRSSYVREAANGQAPDCYHAQAGDTLVMIDETMVSGWYRVTAPGNCEGYVYGNRVDRRDVPDRPSWAGRNDTDVPPHTIGVERTMRACSFNMKFPGIGSSKEYGAMVDMMEDYDLVLVQELAAAPVPMTFGGNTLQPTTQSREFFDLMGTKGFAYALSTAKTGPNNNGANNNHSEYFVAFYKPGVLRYHQPLSRFLSTTLVGNSIFDRVPWRFNFSTLDNTFDFAVTNVHLAQEDSDDAQRVRELAEIARLGAQDPERDQLIVGDMNFQDCDEMQAALPPGYSSLNAGCLKTNVGVQDKPFDHVLYRQQHSGNEVMANSFSVIDLVERMRPTWNDPDEPFPQVPPTNANTFAKYYSDHRPVEWTMRYGIRDDD